MIYTREHKRKLGRLAILMVVLLSSAPMFGFALEEASPSLADPLQAESEDMTTIEREKIVEKSGESRGVIGDTVNVVGEILAFPFHIVAQTFRAAF
ncbi:MAG: hypothetical protein HY584_03480 [Candidatus Omnitrophica bacterium]|nr:hypothetical protein [Candidatus Omnitrophota bacterium]